MPPLIRSSAGLPPAFPRHLGVPLPLLAGHVRRRLCRGADRSTCLPPPASRTPAHTTPHRKEQGSAASGAVHPGCRRVARCLHPPTGVARVAGDPGARHDRAMASLPPPPRAGTPAGTGATAAGTPAGAVVAVAAAQRLQDRLRVDIQRLREALVDTLAAATVRRALRRPRDAPAPDQLPTMCVLARGGALPAVARRCRR